ncbi:Putative uncharacterized protein [Lacticaseibacillus paracasei]|nr:Putative uncharacterized protein [Lacticaseibacillus paracasei]
MMTYEKAAYLTNEADGFIS